jgi:hypothetical protein
MSEAEVVWYRAREGRPEGPFTLRQMQEMVQQGLLRHEDLVWREGMADWTQAQRQWELWHRPDDRHPWGGPGACGTPGLIVDDLAGAMAGPGVGGGGETPTIGGAAAAPEASAGMRWLLPVGRSGWAIAAGYLGLFSLFGGCVGPFAVIVAIIAILDVRQNPSRHGMGRAVFGLVLGLLGCAFLMLILVASILR